MLMQLPNNHSNSRCDATSPPTPPPPPPPPLYMYIVYTSPHFFLKNLPNFKIRKKIVSINIYYFLSIFEVWQIYFIFTTVKLRYDGKRERKSCAFLCGRLTETRFELQACKKLSKINEKLSNN